MLVFRAVASIGMGEFLGFDNLIAVLENCVLLVEKLPRRLKLPKCLMVRKIMAGVGFPSLFMNRFD